MWLVLCGECPEASWGGLLRPTSGFARGLSCHFAVYAARLECGRAVEFRLRIGVEKRQKEEPSAAFCSWEVSCQVSAMNCATATVELNTRRARSEEHTSELQS